ncbi:hypothetical protein WR25_21148 [Diploscapter pachys]|uniref:TEA domain-containing protein n=1 Tax=Diploscapter pachys TaxID=2018661 RepID=A0A2A2L9N2_9BILA|nr:hypothetical protein WR25_21148 [Diploscapter pachys]
MMQNLGRNELIARYIKLRCGKTRTRKQVSSHIQVLARKKVREEHTKHKTENGLLPDTILPLTPKPRINGIQMPSSSPGHLPFDHTHLSASLSPTVAALSAASATSLVASPLHADAVAKDHLATQQLINKLQSTNPAILPAMCNPFWATNLQLPFQITSAVQDIKPPVTSLSCNTEFSNSRCIMSSDIELISFTAYVENAENGNRVNLVNIPGNPEDMENIKIDSIYEKYPNSLRELFQKCPKDRFYLAKCWANIEFEGDPKSLTYAVDAYYKSMKKFDIRVATQVCSFGTKAVEKIESFKPVNYNALVGPYTYNLENSSMCEYMTKFISELKKLQFQEWMNNVLENFTVLQIVSNKDTDETLLVMCFLFEVSEDQEANYSVFRLIE